MSKREEILKRIVEQIGDNGPLKTFDEYFCSLYTNHSYWKVNDYAIAKYKGNQIKFSKDGEYVKVKDANGNLILYKPSNIVDDYKFLAKVLS